MTIFIKISAQNKASVEHLIDSTYIKCRFENDSLIKEYKKLLHEMSGDSFTIIDSFQQAPAAVRALWNELCTQSAYETFSDSIYGFKTNKNKDKIANKNEDYNGGCIIQAKNGYKLQTRQLQFAMANNRFFVMYYRKGGGIANTGHICYIQYNSYGVQNWLNILYNPTLLPGKNELLKEQDPCILANGFVYLKLNANW